MGKGFLDGRVCQFPNYEAVLPQRSKLTTVATVQLNKKQTEHLKRLVKTYKRKDCDCIVESDCENSVLVIRGYHVTDCEALNGEFVVRIPADGLKPFKMGLNFRYLVEALLSDYITPPFTLETEGPSQDGSTKPLVIRYDMPQAYIGVIMPLRIDRILKGGA